MHLYLFPENGLNGSLHAPVLIGLVVLTYFSERLGWTYAGLVVPGYLATVFVQAPYTGLLIIAEALLTYWLTALVGLWIPKLGAWSSTFGRERFFLFIIGAVIVRLAVEGSVVPWLSEHYEIAHARELYSIGLALVPLLANAFWNGGLRTALPRLALVTWITFACVKYVLLPYTNFTVSRFAMANEAVSLTFLDSPHAHIILIVGALLGARNNVLYGWDYNGILVPALLAVAWYQPLKLATTVVEAIVVYQLAKLLSERGPLKRFLIVGSRRMLVVFITGFLLKTLLGFVAVRFAPGIQVVDFYGFGYLLPSLLAVKIWNRQKIGTVIMPTLQVSLTGFVMGNALGFGLAALDERWGDAQPMRDARAEISRNVPLELVLGDSAPRASGKGPIGKAEAHDAALAIVRDLRRDDLGPALDRAAHASLVIRRPVSQHGWYTLVPRADDPEDDRIAPRLALRSGEGGGSWLIIAEAERAGSEAPAVAHALAGVLGARAIVVESRLPAVQKLDITFAERLAEELDTENVLWVRTHADRARLAVVGAVPEGLDLAALSRTLQRDLPLEFVARNPNLPVRVSRAARIELTGPLSERVAAQVLNAPDVVRWSGEARRELGARLKDLTRVSSSGYAPPSIEELRLFSSSVWPAVVQVASGGIPSPWQRAVAGALGYVFVQSGDSWLLLEPAGPNRRGNATLLIGPRSDGAASELAIEVPAALWEQGSFAAALGLHGALRAGLLIVPGAMPNSGVGSSGDLRRAAARRSFYNRAHEEWLARGANVVAVHAISAERAVEEDVVVSFGGEVPDAEAGPRWSLPVVASLRGAGLRVGAYDGSFAHAPFEGSTNPAFDYARTFAPGQMLVLWLSMPVRERWLRIQNDAITEQRLSRFHATLVDAPPAQRALELISCAKGLHANALQPCPRLETAAACRIEERARAFAGYTESGNPFELWDAVLGARDGCHVELLRDPETGLHWALVFGAARLHLILLQPGAAESARTLHDPDELARAVALGISSVRYEVE